MSMYEIYERIRNEKGVTNAEVSRATGISAATLSQWKKGLYVPKQEKLEKIANFLSVPVEYLKTGVVPSTIDKEVSKIAQTVFDNQNIRMIVEGARTLHDNEQEYVLNLIRLLNSKH